MQPKNSSKKPRNEIGHYPRGISVVIPAYNEEGNIERVVQESLAALRKLTPDHEVIVLNDGSADRTQELLEQLAKNEKALRVLKHECNLGVGMALRDLWKATKYEYIIDLPGDGQQPPAEIALFVPLMENADVVCSYRKKRVDSAHRSWLKNLYHFILRVLFRVKVRDIDWIKMYSKSVLDSISLTSRSSFVIAEALIRAQRAGFRITEVAVTHMPRTAGKQTGAKPKVMVKQLLDVFKFWFAVNFLGR